MNKFNNTQDKTKRDLIKSGRKLFLKKGFKNTSVSEITERSEIATGTFYNYFSSKEELFLMIFFEENNRLKKEILKNVNLEEEPEKVVKNLIYQFFVGMQKNIILREFFNQNTFSKIEKKTEFNEEKYGEIAYQLFIPIIEKYQNDNIIVKKDPKYVIAFFDAVLYVYLHKDDIGARFFPMLMDDLIKYIVQGLKKEPN
ncbi:MAG: TetR/AcrR family transcriptional regulator [Bacillota bacterium]